MVATFIDSWRLPTFLADRPGLYWMPFQRRQLPAPRIVSTPSPPSTYFVRSSFVSDIAAALTGGRAGAVMPPVLITGGMTAPARRDATIGAGRPGAVNERGRKGPA